MIIVLAATNRGLGKMPDLLTHDSILIVGKVCDWLFAMTRNCSISDTLQLIYTTDILYVLAIFTAKFAVALLYHRLSSSSAQNFWSSAIMIACGVLCLVSVLIVAVQQRPSAPWIYGRATAGGRVWNDSVLYQVGTLMNDSWHAGLRLKHPAICWTSACSSFRCGWFGTCKRKCRRKPRLSLDLGLVCRKCNELDRFVCPDQCQSHPNIDTASDQLVPDFEEQGLHFRLCDDRDYNPS